MTFISVIIPEYNCEFYLAEAVGSVRQQGDKPLEIVIVGDSRWQNL
jgi:glycosyltransferase involved in cell wall biosynthesis